MNVPDPRGVNIVKVEAARDMLAAVEAALPADVAVFAAAVADWRSASNSREKIKKTGKSTPELALIENLQRENLNAIEEAQGYRGAAKLVGTHLRGFQ